MHRKRTDYREVTILLVDDDDVDAMGVRRAMDSLKILNPMVRARDGVEALALLRSKDTVPKPFLILLDLNMPRMSGMEMLEELRRDPELSSSIVFVLTTSEAEQDKLAAYQQHVAGYIVKRHIKDGFIQMMSMLDHYWKVVELPDPGDSK